jgi:hypothetical protein
MRPPSSALPALRRALHGPADVANDELAAFAAADLGAGSPGWMYRTAVRLVIAPAARCAGFIWRAWTGVAPGADDGSAGERLIREG